VAQHDDLEMAKKAIEALARQRSEQASQPAPGRNLATRNKSMRLLNAIYDKTGGEAAGSKM